MADQTATNPIVVTQTKSMGMAVLLTVLFGPIGMLYSTIGGGILMIIISAIVAALTMGFGLLVTWPICIIWAALAVKGYNNRLHAGRRMH